MERTHFLCDFSWRSEQKKKSLIMGLHDEERIKRRQSWNFMMNKRTSVSNHGEFHDEQRNECCQSWRIPWWTKEQPWRIPWWTEKQASPIMDFHDEQRIKRCQSWNFMFNGGKSINSRGNRNKAFVCGFLTMLVRWILTYSIRNTVHIDFFVL